MPSPCDSSCSARRPVPRGRRCRGERLSTDGGGSTAWSRRSVLHAPAGAHRSRRPFLLKATHSVRRGDLDARVRTAGEARPTGFGTRRSAPPEPHGGLHRLRRALPPRRRDAQRDQLGPRGFWLPGRRRTYGICGNWGPSQPRRSRSADNARYWSCDPVHGRHASPARRRWGYARLARHLRTEGHRRSRARDSLDASMDDSQSSAQTAQADA